MARFLAGPLLVLMLVVSAAALSLARPAAQRILNLPATPYRYATVELPPHFGQPGRTHDNTPPDNPLSDDGATLGRVLFYDTRLSANNTTSCASCHVQAHAFADPKPFSKGFHGALTDRRAMPLVNVRYYQRARFFWDERAGNLEEMVLLPIQSRIEMGQDLTQVINTFARDGMYPTLFARAFGDRQITEQRIGRALAQFVRSMMSYQSRYDEGRARAQSPQDDFGNFTLQENRGKALFLRNCGTCHMKAANEHFFVPAPVNTRLRADNPAADGGVGDVTLRATDFGSFKSPSLRNVEVTAPYAHDGRFATLDALIDHYSDNPIPDPDHGYYTSVAPLKFTPSEKAALIAFLKTLTDRTMLTDPRFSNPFVVKDDAVRVKRIVVTPGAMLMALSAAAAQTPVVLRSVLLVPEQPPLPLPPLPAPEPSHAAIERLMSFDSNADHRISRHELPERMQELVARGDRNADAGLDSNEILFLASAARIERAPVPFRSLRSAGLADVIKDLKLPATKHAGALAIVRRNKLPSNFEDPTGSTLYAKMKALLDDEEYENFVAAASRLSRSPQGIAGSPVKLAIIN
ncbi:MAG TPA: cytochrome c peroxidase [Burkholderiales bacterium]|nr:cytochrome c peroxidase [Burkholderiales bacterium]